MDEGVLFIWLQSATSPLVVTYILHTGPLGMFQVNFMLLADSLNMS